MVVTAYSRPEPGVEIRCAETPQLSETNTGQFTSSSHFENGFRMDLEESRSLSAIHQRFKRACY